LDFRLILDGDLPGQENMARDTAILRSLEDGSGTPTLRLYGWDVPTISIGYLQSAEPFMGLGLPVVRRTTGGRAVVHSSEVTYSVTGLIADPLFSGGVMAAYSVISGCIMAALADAGVSACFSRSSSAPGARSEACFYSPSRYEVLIDGRKLVGSAQRRLRRAFIQHGSILMSIDEGLNRRVFGKSLSGRMAGVSEFSAVSRDSLRGLLAQRFAEGLRVSLKASSLSPGEAAMSASLLASCLVSPGNATGKSAHRA